MTTRFVDQHVRSCSIGLCVVAAMTSFAGSAAAQCESQRLVAPADAPTSGFARTMAVHGNVMAVAGQADDLGNSSVYIYLFDELTGSFGQQPVQEILPATDEIPDLRGFGSSISMTSDALAIAGALDPDDDGDGVPTVEVRGWDPSLQLFDSFPTRWDPGEYSPTSQVATETIVCKMGRVELARSARGRGLTTTRIMLGGSRSGEAPDETIIEGFVLDLGTDAIFPRGVITRNTENGTALWVSPPDARTAAALFWDPIGPDLGPRLTVFELNGDELLPAAVVETTLPAGTIADLSGDGRPDIAAISAVVDPDSDGDGLGDVEMRVFRRSGDTWLETDVLSTRTSDNPLYQSSTTVLSNPVYEGRTSEPLQLIVLAMSDDVGSSSVDAHVWDILPDIAAKKVAKFKAGKALADTVKLAGGHGGGGAGGSLIVAFSCDCCDDDCDGIISIIDVNGDDCNDNGVCDSIDIASGTSSDADGNDVPDECDLPVVDRPFGGLITNAVGDATVSYNEPRNRLNIEIADASTGTDNGARTTLGGLRGYLAELQVAPLNGLPIEGGIQMNLTPVPGVNALPVSLHLPQLGDEVLCQLDTSNMGAASEIIVKCLGADGSVRETLTLLPPYGETLVSLNMTDSLPAVDRCVCVSGQPSSTPEGVEDAPPYLRIGVSLTADAAVSSNGVVVPHVRQLVFELFPDMSGGPLGELSNPLYEQNTTVGTSPLFEERGGVEPPAPELLHLHSQGVVHRDIAARGLGQAVLSGAGQVSPGSIRVANLSSSGDDGIIAMPDSVLSAAAMLRDNMEFELSVLPSVLRGTSSQLDVLAQHADGRETGYRVLQTDPLVKEVHALEPTDGLITATVEAMIAGDVVRSFTGELAGTRLASVIFVEDWPTSALIGSKQGQTTTGRIGFSDVVGVLLPGREAIDLADELRFEWTPVSGSRGDAAVAGVTQASIRTMGIDEVLIHDIDTVVELLLCDGDANADGAVDLADLLLVISNWGTANVQADMNGNGVVDLADLLLVISNWGCQG